MSGGKVVKLPQPIDVSMGFLRGFTQNYPEGTFVQLVAIVPDGPTKAMTLPLAELDKFEPFINEHNGKRNIYVCTNPLKHRVGKKACKEDIAYLCYLQADIDLPKDAKTDRDEARKKLLSSIEGFEPRFNVLVESGNGYAAFLRLAEPIAITGNTEAYFNEVEVYSRGLAKEFDADKCHNIDRLMRMPGTLNLPTKVKRKRGCVKVESRLIHLNDGVNSLDAVAFLAEKAEPELEPVAAGVDVDALRVSSAIKKLIREGDDAKRSEALLKVVKAMVAGGHEDATIRAVCLTPDLKISDHPREQKDPDRAVNRCISKARRDHRPATQVIREEGGRLGKNVVRGGGTVFSPVTSFTMEPLEAIRVPDEGEFVRARLKAVGGKVQEVTLDPRAWVSNQSLIRQLPGKEFVFTGTSVDVQHLREYLGGFEMPHRTGTRTAGFHDGLFLTEEGVLGAGDELVFLGDPSRCKLITKTPATKDEARAIGKEIMTNVPKVVLPIVGWSVACFWKKWFTDTFGAFPLLVVTGEAGAGKSLTTKLLVARPWALDREPFGIGQQTRFTFMKTVDSSNTIPVMFEENKQSRMSPRSANLVSELIRETYNANEGQRGRADQSVSIYRYQAPVCIIGETGFSEPAAMDRCVIVSMSRRDSAPHKEKYDRLYRHPMGKVGRALLDLRLRRPDIADVFAEELAAVDPALTDRPRYNAAVVRVGLRMLGEVLERVFDGSFVDAAVVDGINPEGEASRLSAVSRILETMGLLSQYHDAKGADGNTITVYDFPNERLERKVHYALDDGPFIRLHVQAAYPLFLKFARTHQYDGDLLPVSDFRSQLRTEPYFVAKKRARIGERSCQCFILDTIKMKESGLTLPDEWGGHDDEPNAVDLLSDQTEF